MSLRQRKRTAAPVAAVTLITFLSTLVPCSAWADPAEQPNDIEVAREWDSDVGLEAETNRRTIAADAIGEPDKWLDTQVAATAGASTPMTNPKSPQAPAPAGAQLSLPQGAGKLRGMGESFSAELSTGIVNYRVPFELPAARGGAQPSLTLSYGSSGGHGIAGVGWGVGVPTISRQLDRGVPKYQDPATGGPWHPEQDRFVFGADELVPICLVSGSTCAGAAPGEAMPVWASGWQYFRARVEGAFLRYFWSPDHRTWRVQDKNGISMELGVPLDGSGDASALETDPLEPTHVFAWHLARKYDAMGEANPLTGSTARPVNVVAYRYAVVDGTSYLTDIFDTPPASSAATAPLSSYAHHARLRYEWRPDATHSYRRGWKTSSTLRLRGVDVTSRDFQSAASARKLVRRYHLAYDPSAHVSLLTSVQMEGRCPEGLAESGEPGLLPESSACPRLPAMTFSYQRVAPFRSDGTPSSADLAGFEGFDERIRAMAASPPRSINESLVDFFDINADGLPDVVVTDPAQFAGGHGLFLSGAGGVADHFAAPQRMCVEGVLGADANVIKLTNSNLLSQDVDGDGVVDLLHMPRVKTYSVYSPLWTTSSACGSTGGTWAWRGRVVTTASQQNVKIDFAQRNADVRHMDVNADGLMDVVYTGPTELQTFLSLGRYPTGDGQYGNAAWTGPTSASISNDPLTSCVPWSAMPVRFSDPDVHVTDMNGDGFPDIVRVRHGDIRYWPGRGDGFWGTGALDCAAGTFGQDRHIQMAASPLLGMLGAEDALLDDVNGDGLADLVRVRFNAVDVYLNVDGIGWTDRHVIEKAPPNSTVGSRVRLLDVNGSGTPDIVWGEGHAYKYIDLAGGARPWVLTGVNNGVGATTDFEYATSVEQMLAAEAAGNAWATKAPMVAHVLSRATTRDNLDRVGRPAGVYVTEYTYRDPIYEGRQREFRGFRTARAKTLGDTNSPTSISESHFLLGECVDEPGTTGHCDVAERWRDNPREALKGRPTLTETFDEAGRYLSTDHTTYRLRQLYTGLDGRAVRHAFAASADSYRYDTGPFVPASSTASLRDVELERVAGAVELESAKTVTLRSSAGRAHLRSAVDVDVFGNVLDAVQYGCVDGCGAVDEPVTAHSVPARAPGDGSGWLWRTAESWVYGAGSPSVRRQHVAHTFDAHGLPTLERVEITGTLPLDRFHAIAAKAIAPAPANAVTDGWIDTFAYSYDAFGNATSVTSPAGHCTDMTTDTPYAQLVVEQSVHSGYVDAAPGPAACGSYALTSFAEYDRGLGVPTSVIGHGGEASAATYDAFGRVTAIYQPDPNSGWIPSAIPSAQFDYYLPTDGVTPYAKVRTRKQDGSTTSVASFAEAWSYVDGLGRTLATVTQADPTAGDAAPWIAGGTTDFDAKGAVYRAYLNAFYSGDPASYPLGTTPTTRSSRRTRDAFGRTTQVYGLDGATTEQKVYRAMSVDTYDAADLEPGGPHENTPATVRVDGHGRAVSSIERVHAGASIEPHETAVTYAPTGEPLVITRSQPSAPSVVRWMRYDSLGRMVLNADPNTTKNFDPSPATVPASMKAWRYAYDRLGQLVGTSDARGCGTNFYYLADGRPLGEDYSPCTAEHPDYTAPDLSIDEADEWPVAVVGDGLEILVRYDGADPDLATVPGLFGSPPMFGPNAGRVTSVSDRGAKTIVQYDARGRTTAVARKIAKPGPPEEFLVSRYTPHWYVKTIGYDGANRPTAESTGADVDAFYGAGSASIVTTQYSKRGAVKSVGGSYGALIGSVTRDPDGLAEQITYGDVAQTSSVFQYDLRQRLSTVLTHRGPPSLWTATPAAYSPAPNPSSGPTVFQTVLEQATFAYDVVDNPIQIVDGRDPSEWPTSFKPSTRSFQYDDLYRLTRVDYSTGDDDWASPYAAENANATGRTTPSPHVSFAKRVSYQTFAYDAVGNTTTTDDDAHGFYDRSLGAITNGTASAGPYQVKQAAQSTSGARDGNLSAAYDDAGNLASLAMTRGGPCLPTGALCSQRYAYEWDEVGHLSRARRWDVALPGAATDPLPSGAADAELRYTYSGDERVLKTAVDPSANELHAVYVFGSLELRRTTYTDGDYERTSATMAPYLGAGGARLARLYYGEEDLPTLSSGRLHVLLELPDHLGSSSFVIDHATSELVEATRYQAYGATESDYRPERWDSYREDYKFTGKEEDIEVGLMYFGARYYAPALQRWVSADPLAVHAPGEADLNLYAYVHGRALRAVDPLGLESWDPNAPGVGGVPGVTTAAETVFVVEKGGATPDSPAGAPGPVGASGHAPPAPPAAPMMSNALQMFSSILGAIDPAGPAKALIGDAVGLATSAMQPGATWTPGGYLRGAARETLQTLEDGTLAGAVAQGRITSAIPAGDPRDVAEKAGSIGLKWAPVGLAAGGGGARSPACTGAGCGGPGVCFVAGTAVATEHGPVPIEQVQLGDRVEAGNPVCADDHIAADAKTITLEMPNPDQPLDRIRIRLVRPSSWIAEQALTRGAAWVDLREVGVAGWATVTTVSAAPKEARGGGCLVLMTIEHVASDVLRLRLDGGQAIELTPTHQLFVEGRGWTVAREITPGMLLRSDEGALRVDGVESARPNQRVYNIEVGREHAYRVTPSRVWSHNTCPGAAEGAARGAARPETRIVSGATVTPKGKPPMTGNVNVGSTLDRIRSGGSFPHPNDGSVFMNKEGRLPPQSQGYYREWVHPTPGVPGPGPQRIVTGTGGELYYTPDHYKSFIPLN